MRPTRRGLAVLALVVLAVLAAAFSGQRSLNAVAAPLLGALGYGVLECWQTGSPTVSIGAVRPGHPGETREVTLSVDGTGIVEVSGDWPAGLAGESIDAVLALPETVSADVRLAERGVHAVDGIAVFRRDSLGLVRTPERVSDRTSVVVYPDAHAVANDAPLSTLLADDPQVERQEFDRLRTYEPGDPLRRVHWKSSAKRDEFVVVGFASDSRTRRLTVAAEAVPGSADGMAVAAATVALHALRAGLDVGLQLPGERLPPGTGEDHRANLLTALARTDAGTLSDATREAADVSIVADGDGTTVWIDDRSVAFEELTAAADPETTREVVRA